MTPHTIEDLERLGYRNTGQHFASLEIWRKDNLYALLNRQEDSVETTLDIKNLKGTIKEHKKHLHKKHLKERP